MTYLFQIYIIFASRCDEVYDFSSAISFGSLAKK